MPQRLVWTLIFALWHADDQRSLMLVRVLDPPGYERHLGRSDPCNLQEVASGAEALGRPSEAFSGLRGIFRSSRWAVFGLQIVEQRWEDSFLGSLLPQFVEASQAIDLQKVRRGVPELLAPWPEFGSTGNQAPATQGPQGRAAVDPAALGIDWRLDT